MQAFYPLKIQAIRSKGQQARRYPNFADSGRREIFLWRKSLIFREVTSQKCPKPAVVKTNPILKKSFL